MTKILETVQKYILLVLVVLYPVFVFSFSATSYVLPKEILLGIFLGVTIVLWIADCIAKKSIKFKSGKFDLQVLIVTAVFVVSGIFQAQNKMEVFLFPGTVTLVISSAVAYFLLNQLDAKGKEGVNFALIISGVLLSVTTLFAQVGILSKIPQLPAFVRDVNFNPMGGNLPSIIYLIVILATTGVFIYKQKDSVYRLFAGVSAVLLVLGIAVLIKNALPGSPQSPRLPDFNTSWQVGVEALKVSPLFGVGPANYLSAFNRFRPVTYNSTDLWQVRFTTATDFYLTVLTELGFAGVAAFVILIWAVYKTVSRKFDVRILPLAAVLVLFAAFPATPTLMFLLFAYLSLSSDSEEKTFNLLGESSAKGAVILICLPVVAALALFYFEGYRLVKAESDYTKSLNALTANDAKGTYNQMTLAITENPNVDRYHSSLAQVDMALAQSIASKTTLSDADKTTITQLVQQAINEGKATVTLNPGRSGNWEVLGQIYRSIMPFATGADQFAIQTYTQAVALDPTNPNLRIALGGVYYALGRYDDAIDAFKLAILAKPDLANAHYNLAVAYQGKKDYDNAITEMNNVLSLVAKGSADYTLAQNTLADLQKNKPAAGAATTTPVTGDLTAPKPVGTSNVKPPITLPSEATPPAATQ